MLTTAINIYLGMCSVTKKKTETRQFTNNRNVFFIGLEAQGLLFDKLRT